MTPPPSRVPYSILTAAADRMLEDCEDDAECIAIRLGELAPDVRDELLVSDLLNAWQVFFFFFRTEGGDLLHELLELEPASALVGGLKIQKSDLLEMIFAVRDAKPVIALSDGETIVATFSGTTAFARGLEFMESPEYR